MAAVCDDYLSCWHLNFGVPGSKNDLNILYLSTLFQRIRRGEWPPSQPKETIAGMELTRLYYLTDSIYPSGTSFSQLPQNMGLSVRSSNDKNMDGLLRTSQGST